MKVKRKTDLKEKTAIVQHNKSKSMNDINISTTTSSSSSSSPSSSSKSDQQISPINEQQIAQNDEDLERKRKEKQAQEDMRALCEKERFYFDDQHLRRALIRYGLCEMFHSTFFLQRDVP